MSVNTANTQELVQAAIQKILTLPLQAESTFLGSGVQVIDSASPVRFPRLDAFTDSLDYVAEGAEIPFSDADFSEVTAMPSSLKGFKRIIPVTDEMLRQSAIDLSSTIQAALVRWMSLRVDAALFAGTGDGKTEVKGLLSQPGTTQHSVTGSLTVDGVREAWAKLLKLHVDVKSLRLFVTPEQLSAFLGEKDGDGRPLMQPDVTQEATWSLYGVPVIVSDSLPTGKAVLADMSKVAVVRDIQQVDVLKEALALRGMVGLRVQARWDVAVLAPEAVCVISVASK